MKNKANLKSKMAMLALEFAPPSIRNDLLDSSSFVDEFNLSPEVILSIGNPENQFHRSKLFAAIRETLSGTKKCEILDTSDQHWELKRIEENSKKGFLLSRNGQNLFLSDFSTLSSDRLVRLNMLKERILNNNLPDFTIDKWRQILTERSLLDEEVDVFESETNNTPIACARSIRNEFIQGQIQISSLVPNSRSYFERLVGVYDGSTTIQDYAATTIKPMFDKNFAWKSYEGFLLNLLLSSHSTITAEINIDPISSEDLVSAYKFLESNGDRISQLGSIEIGLRMLPSRPEIEPILLNIIKQIRDDDINQVTSGFNVLSGLFMFVDGELSRLRMFSSEPPFYRRLAALTQAALIHRQLINCPINIESFSKWMFDSSAEQFYMQSLTDTRLEPRWNPEFAIGSQIKFDFLGQLILTAKKYEVNIKESPLLDLLHSIETEALNSSNNLYACYLPGPLEGQEQTNNIMPGELIKEIETQLNNKDIELSSFIALVNSSLIYHIEPFHADLAANALKLGNHRLANIKDRSQFIAILDGLASVAATTRSETLADELQLLIRRYRHDAQYSLSINEDIRICLVAAACNINLIAWSNYVGKWLTELAFCDLGIQDGLTLYSHLHYLCHAVPELWVSCGRADAALKAFIAYKNN
jgi:hypothetical protein